MATMVKEKRREKKKTKEKNASKSSVEREQPSISSHFEDKIETESGNKTVENIIERTIPPLQESVEHAKESVVTSTATVEPQPDVPSAPSEVSLDKEEISIRLSDNETIQSQIESAQSSQSIKVTEITQITNLPLQTSSASDTYQNLNSRLERIAIPRQNMSLSLEEIQNRLENPMAYLKLDEEARNKTQIQENIQVEILESIEVTTPSAPVFEEQVTSQTEVIHETKEIVEEATPELKCMPLEEAIRLYGGKEIAEVRAMSDREEAIVQAGVVSAADHPLIDLLSTFRTSLIAVERERTLLAKGFADEEKFRNSVWKVEKKHITVSETCACGAAVQVKAAYELAELLKERLPVAKLRLEGLLRDVQESYCHHQHAALLAHCQIEELISETIQSNKPSIRIALSLVLQALRVTDSEPATLATALQRWAAILSAALTRSPDLSQLLFLLHHLFRQTRSVSWAARVVSVPATDRSSAAKALALLDLLMTRTRLEPAVECTEDAAEEWEEVCARGGGGVSDGALRERDLLALWRALPLRDILARILLFTHADITSAREHEWGDSSGGRSVLKACCGVRTLLSVLHGVVTSHPQYSRLRRAADSLAVAALRGLAALHAHSRQSYLRELELQISSELQAAFILGAHTLSPRLHCVPAALLPARTAASYCTHIIVGLHDNPLKLECLSLHVPECVCEDRVLMVSQAAVDRADDHELARMVLDFLMQTGLKRKPVPCKVGCERAAREQLPRLLAAHPYLHTIAFHMLADLHQAEPQPPTSIEALSPARWRPTPGELRALLDDWALRCPALIQHLLLQVDCTPHRGLTLDCQLAIGSWLCTSSLQSPSAWSVLRRLHLHRTSWADPAGWAASLDVPSPPAAPQDLFSTAYAVLASSWGHCIPLICSEGVSALCRLATTRVSDAVHCLAPVMLVMSQSPASVSLTPRFGELFSIILKSGPTVVQRALGLGPEPGADMLLRVILSQLENSQAGIPRSSILSCWLHALWPVGGAAVLDTALLAVRDWPLLDEYVAGLLQDTKASEHITTSVRNSWCAPLLCSCVLRVAHGVQARSSRSARVLDVLHVQRTVGDRIHVDNALKQIGANMPADELVIYRCATALLSAPTQHPSHLMLWTLFVHLYLQRPASMPDTTPPIGPLFFSGLIKSRLLAQLRKKLQDTVTYHHNELDTLKQNQKEEPKPPPRSKKEQPKIPKDETVLPMLTIADLTGESSESESESSEEESEKEIEEQSSKSETDEKKDTVHLLRYHAAAETMCRDFLQWLDIGDKIRAMPHNADVARYISEQALSAAWSRELSRRRPIELEPPAPPTRNPALPPRQTPFQTVIAVLMSIRDRSGKRSSVGRIKSPVEGVNWRDARSVLSEAEKHLNVIHTLQKEWSSEVSQISSLDAALWQLVTQLRVSRPLPAVQKRCPNNCRPITIHIPHIEWCISTGAESGIQDNRRSARSLTRRLARPRPHAARSAAALAVVASRVSSVETARRVAEAAWRRAGVAAPCAPADRALAALVDDLAQNWLCSDSALCADLVLRWSANSTPLQHRMVGSLARPMRLPAPVRVYSAILAATLPDMNVFSCLSKFEMSRWSDSLDPSQRQELLDGLLTAAQRWGPNPDSEHHMLLELLGVHTTCLLTPHTLPAHILKCARASASCALPPAHWTHVVRAANAHATLLTFDQLGNLLRELGVIWWEARTGLTPSKCPHYAAYSTHVAGLLHTLQRAFVAAANALSYAPERVSLYAWSALQESWSAWIRPHCGAPPLLPSTDDDEAYTAMLRHFVDNIHQVMLDCPGTEAHLLEQIFEWTVQTYLSESKAGSQECGVQLSALLVELRAMPWCEHQWVSPAILRSAMQVCASKDREIQWWSAQCWRNILAESWLRGASDDQLAPLLASILYLFTAMPLLQQTLDQATRLPWWRLPEAALEEAFERFFTQYHDPAHPYHELPQFRVLLSASELTPCSPPTAAVASSRHKRGSAVSRIVLAAAAPALSHHVRAHTETLLPVIADVAPHVTADELAELLSRAAVIMCMEPAATAALPVWQRVVSSWPPHLSGACVTAAGHLTAFEYFASLADTATRTLLDHKEGGSWHDIAFRWQSSPWTGASPLLARGKLYAGYGITRAHVQSHSEMRTALLALLAADVNFIENEPIVSVWICLSCRLARGPAGGAGAEDAGDAARALLARWGQHTRRSLLQAVTMQADTAAPTAVHRLLCRLALCIVSNSESAVRSYEAACTAVLGSNSDVMSWGKSPHPRKLPRLAIRLHPTCEKYFNDELDLAPEDS